jgi:hypothetical protein
MDSTVTQLIFLESGGFTGLQRGCVLQPAALPELPRSELQQLVQQTSHAQEDHLASGRGDIPDMQTYTLELVMQPRDHETNANDEATQHRVLRYAASDVPADLSELFDFLRGQARPIEPR